MPSYGSVMGEINFTCERAHILLQKNLASSESTMLPRNTQIVASLRSLNAPPNVALYLNRRLSSSVLFVPLSTSGFLVFPSIYFSFSYHHFRTAWCSRSLRHVNVNANSVTTCSTLPETLPRCVDSRGGGVEIPSPATPVLRESEMNIDKCSNNPHKKKKRQG